MNALLKDLLTTTQLERAAGEPTCSFLFRLVEALDNLNEQEFEALSTTATDWFNETVDNINKMTEKLFADT